MCGVAGVLNHDGSPVDRAALDRASTSIAHRGPDDQGIHVDGIVGLAHRRLSIIDVSPAGRGPMANEDQTVWLTYNGEIYNFRELRRLLEARGHRFRSHTDSEVLVHGWEEWGEQLVERLNGIFAFAIWDARSRELFLARDRFGIKPLYVATTRDQLVFASEAKAILAYQGAPATLSLPALMEYMTFQNVLGERTLFDGITMLPAGTTVRVAADGTKHWRQYFDPVPLDGGDAGDPDSISTELRAVLQHAVDRQLMSDVPLGAYLSGGMDSASLVALASRRIPHIHTFTAGFDLTDSSPLELAADERGDAEIVAREVGSEHYEAVLHAGDMERVLPSLVWHLEDLRAGTSYQNFYVARLASRFVKVVLAGTGGDELFAGYPWRYKQLEQIGDGRGFSDVYYQYWCRLVPDEQKRELFTADAFEQASTVDPRESFDQVTAHLPQLEPIDRALYFEQRTFLHGLLVVEDKLSMAHSMEARVPLLDNELVDFSLRLPGRLKNMSPEGKRLLRDAARSFLPSALVSKRKQGFSPPDRSWYQGRNLRYIRETLLDSRTLSRGVIRPSFIERTIAQHAAGGADHRLLIWSLLCLEWWHRVFVDAAPTTAPVSAAGLAA
jgi:asparagine synthase (glutamine-hydrolysing)